MEDLVIYNSILGKKEKFSPITPGYVGLYVCGPTVYSEPHIGNVRTFCSFDLVVRYFIHLGYKVRYVRNITDAGHLTNESGEGVNRMESQAKIESLEPMEIVQKYTTNFHNIMSLFNTLPPSIEPTATGHIIEQIEVIEKLIQNGFAYEANGSVYFDVKTYSNFHNYGELSGRKIDDLIAGYRDLDGQEEKRNSIDFALWKKATPEHIMQWNSPWGKGFPGWHLECSAMSTKYLGEEFDIHGGGMDLKFPHHECEIAQNKGSFNKGGARYWMHTNMLNFNGKKMSKSLGNSILPIEFITGNHPLLDRGYSPSVIRFLFLQTHYASELDINVKSLQDAEKGFKKIMNALSIVEKTDVNQFFTSQDPINSRISELCQNSYDAINDDLNTSVALAQIFELSTLIHSIANQQVNSSKIDKQTFEKLCKFFKSFIIDIFGLKPIEEGNQNKLNELMEVVIKIRQNARENKDFSTSDFIRDELLKINIQIKDTKDGTNFILN